MGCSSCETGSMNAAAGGAQAPITPSQWRDLLQLEGGPNHHRKLAQSLQHQASTLCAWLSPAGTARDRTKARPSGHHELISQCVWYKKSVSPGAAAQQAPT